MSKRFKKFLPKSRVVSELYLGVRSKLGPHSLKMDYTQLYDLATADSVGHTVVSEDHF